MSLRRWIITLGACLLLVAGLAAIKVTQIRAAIAFGESFPEPSAHVEAVIATATEVEMAVTALGEVIPPQAVELRNELEGRVVAVNMEAGQQVEAGAVLLQLDVSEETAQLQAAQARVNLARLDLERVRKLLASKSVSAERADQARAEFEMAEATARSLQSVIERKTLRAPFAAIVGLHELEAGEFLQSNTPIVALLGVTPTLWIDFNLPLTQVLPALGEAVRIVVADAAQPAALLPAHIIARESLASATSRNIRFRAELPADPRLTPHAVVRVQVPQARASHVVLPAAALLRDSLGDYVYVLTPDAAANGWRAQRRPVVVEREEAQTVVIRAGLQGGEKVATEGAFKLRDQLLAFVDDKGVNEAAVSKSGSAVTAAATPAVGAP